MNDVSPPAPPVAAAPVLDPIPLVKKPNGNIGRKPSEAQMAALRKGNEVLKAKREAMKVKKAEKKARIKAGEVVDDSSEDDTPAPPKEPKPIKLDVINLAPIKKPRKPRSDAGVEKTPHNSKYATRDDLMAFKDSLMNELKTTPVIKEVEKPVERIVDRIVEKEVPVHTTKVLTGSAMLNKLFFNMD